MVHLRRGALCSARATGAAAACRRPGERSGKNGAARAGNPCAARKPCLAHAPPLRLCYKPLAAP